MVLKHFSPEIFHFQADDEFSGQESDYTDAVYQKLHSGQPPYQLTFRHTRSCSTIFVSIDISHALIDGASMAILLRDWNLAYQDKLPKRTVPSFQTLIQHIQYRASEAAISYWTQHLSGLQPCLLRLKRTSSQSTEREQRFVPLHLPPIKALQKICKETSTTLSNLFHAVWAIALHLANKSKAQQVAFGYLASGRDVPLEDVEDAVGPYFNLLISRYHIEREQPLRSVLQTVRDTMTERLPFQNFSWPEMQDYVLNGKQREGPVFDTVIIIHRFAPLVGSNDRSQIEFMARPRYDPLSYDIELTGKIDTGIRLSLMYWSTSVTDEFASELASSMERIVDKILEDLDTVVGDFYFD